jgi:hypothetical protein
MVHRRPSDARARCWGANGTCCWATGGQGHAVKRSALPRLWPSLSLPSHLRVVDVGRGRVVIPGLAPPAPAPCCRVSKSGAYGDGWTRVSPAGSRAAGGLRVFCRRPPLRSHDWPAAPTSQPTRARAGPSPVIRLLPGLLLQMADASHDRRPPKRFHLPPSPWNEAHLERGRGALTVRAPTGATPPSQRPHPPGPLPHAHL